MWCGEGDIKQSAIEDDMHLLFNEEEFKVAQILLDMKMIIAESNLRGCWPLTWATVERLVWGVKRKRSKIDSGLSVSNPITSSAPPVLPVQKISQNECNKKTGGQVKVEATSPSTPLAFSPSESDDKSKHCHRKSSKKRSREELLNTVKELTENGIALRGELERVKNHHNAVLAYNRELKAMKQQVESSMICHKREEPHLEISQRYHLGLSLGRGYQIALVPVAHLRHHQGQQQQPSMVDSSSAATELFIQTREQFLHHQQQQYPYVVQHHHQVTPSLFSSNRGLDMVNHVVGPLGSIPELNAFADEGRLRDSFQPLDYSRARAFADQRAKYAEARRERQMKRKFKQQRR